MQVVNSLPAQKDRIQILAPIALKDEFDLRFVKHRRERGFRTPADYLQWLLDRETEWLNNKGFSRLSGGSSRSQPHTVIPAESSD